MGALTVCDWQVMAGPICCWHFQTLIISITLLQPLWTMWISNSLSVSLNPLPRLPKDRYPLPPKGSLSTNNNLGANIYNSLMTCAAIYDIYNLWIETAPKTGWSLGYNPGLESVPQVRKPQPLLFSPWRQVAALLPLCQATLWLCWSFGSLLTRQENLLKAFRRSEHPHRILGEWAYLFYDLTCH